MQTRNSLVQYVTMNCAIECELASKHTNISSAQHTLEYGRFVSLELYFSMRDDNFDHTVILNEINNKLFMFSVCCTRT